MKLSVKHLALSALLLPLLLSGCGHKDGGGGGSSAKIAYPTDRTITPVLALGKYGGNLTYVGLSDPKTFNYWVSSDADSGAISAFMLDTLEGRDSFTYKFIPRLAELPKISADGLTYTYTLRPNLKWSDGQPLTADDVLFTLDMAYDPKTQGVLREGLLIDTTQPDGSVKRAPFGYKKLDARTIVFTLPQKYAPAQSIFSSFPIAPKHVLEAPYKAGQINTTWGTNTPASEFVGCGPFVISDFKPGQRIVYKRNPFFWRKDAKGGTLPYLDTFTYLIVPDTNTMALKFRSGETDVLDVPTTQYPDIKKAEANSDYTVINRGANWGNNWLSFNQNPHSKNDPDLIALFRDTRFRQAIAYAVNRQRIADDVFLGLAKPLYGPDTPADTLFYDPNVTQYPYDLAKAKSLLLAMGLTSGQNGKLLWRGKPVKFTIVTNVENDLRKQISVILADDLSKLGLDVNFVPVAFNDLIRRVDGAPYDWQCLVLGFTGGPEPHDAANIWRSSGPTHQWWPKQTAPATPWEAQIDKLMVQGDHEMNPDKRKAIYAQFQEVVAQQQPLIFTVYNEQFTAMRNHYGNVQPSGLYSLGGSTVWNAETIYDTTATKSAP